MASRIQAISYYLPESTVSNDELAELSNEYTAEKIYSVSGVRNRHEARPGESASDLAVMAAETLFSEHADIDRAQIDALLFCAEFLDYRAPVTACLIHKRLALNPRCVSLDTPAGCTGFMNGLLLAKSLIASGQARNVLLLTAEVPSVVIKRSDLPLRMLFGDAAAATLICRHHCESIGEFEFGTDGNGSHALMVEKSGAKDPVTIAWLDQHKDEPSGLAHGRLLMNGADILNLSLMTVPDLIRNVLIRNRLTMEQIDLFIFHQASNIVLNALQKKCGIPDNKFHVYMEETGNTVSATIPIALRHAIISGKTKAGDKVALIGFGIGFSWSGTIIHI